MNIFILTGFICFALVNNVTNGISLKTHLLWTHQKENYANKIIGKHQFQLRGTASVALPATKNFLGIILIPCK